MKLFGKKGKRESSDKGVSGIKYAFFWLVVMFVAIVISFNYFHWIATLASFLAGMIVISISLFEDFYMAK